MRASEGGVALTLPAAVQGCAPHRPLPACIGGALRQRFGMKRTSLSLLFALLAAFTHSAFAKIKTATVTYKDGSAEL